MFLPRALSATTDAQNAIVRLKKVFHAPLIQGDAFEINPDQKFAVEVRGASFEWEEGASVKAAREKREKESKGKGKGPKETPKAKETVETAEAAQEAAPFQVVNVDLLIPRGTLVAVVGMVGSGKVCNSPHCCQKY